MKTSKARVLLCAVMTMLMLVVAMSVSADATIGTITTANGDGDVVVTVPVSGVTGKATILVYPTDKTLAEAKADPMNLIKYIDEAVVADGEAAFVFAVAEGQYKMTVGGGNSAAVEADLDATVNVAPTYANDTAEVAKDSGAYTNEAIGTFAATDEGDTLAYDIDAEAKAAGFAVDTATGAVTFTGTLVDGEYEVTITATDAKGATATCVVTVKVTTPNVAPEFDAEIATAINVEAGAYVEEALVVGAFAATDADNDVLTYSIDAEAMAAGFAIDANGALTYKGTLAADTYYVKVNVTDGEATASISLTITAAVSNKAPEFVSGTEEASMTIGEYVNYAVGTVVATDANDDKLTFSIEGEGFAIDAEGNITFNGTVAEETKLTATVTVSDGALSDTTTITVVVNDVDAFEATEITFDEDAVVKVAADAADFSAAVGIPATATVKYIYGNVTKELEAVIEWDFDAALENGIENGDTVTGTVVAENIDFGELDTAVSFKYILVEASFAVKVNGYEGNVLNITPGTMLDIATEYVGLGNAVYASKLTTVGDADSEKDIPADEAFDAELSSFDAPAAGKSYRLIIYVKDTATGNVMKAVKFIYGYNPYNVSVTFDGYARYWGVKLGESVEIAQIVTDYNTGLEVVKDYEVAYEANGEAVNATFAPEATGVYIVKAIVTIDGETYEGQRTLYVMNNAFTAMLNVNDEVKPQMVAENSEMKVDPILDFIPAEGLDWYATIVNYNTDVDTIEVDEWSNTNDVSTATVNAGTVGTKKVVALFKRVAEEGAEAAIARTTYVREADKLYVITGLNRDDAAFTSAAIGDDTIAVKVDTYEGPKALDELTMKVNVREYRYDDVIWTSDEVAATEAVEITKADWFEKIVDPAEGKPAIRNAVRVEFVLYEGETVVGSTVRVLYL